MTIQAEKLDSGYIVPVLDSGVMNAKRKEYKTTSGEGEVDYLTTSRDKLIYQNGWYDALLSLRQSAE